MGVVARVKARKLSLELDECGIGFLVVNSVELLASAQYCSVWNEIESLEFANGAGDEWERTSSGIARNGTTSSCGVLSQNSTVSILTLAGESFEFSAKEGKSVVV